MEHLQRIWLDPARSELRDLLAEVWRTRAFSIWYERPLLLAFVLHDQALEQGADHPLGAIYLSCRGSGRALEVGTVRDAIRLLAESPAHRELLRSGYVQTNETSRGIAWLWPVAALSDLLGDRIRLYDLGASAGLNLLADRMPPVWKDAAGKPLRLSPIPSIVRRVGMDRAPVDVRDPVAARHLRASIWADDQPRLERLDLAIRLAREAAAQGEFALREADLLEMPDLIRHDGREAGAPAVLYHTFASDYLPTSSRDQFERRMSQLLLDLPENSLWIEFESARSTPGVRLAAGSARAELRIHRNLGGMVVKELVARAAPHPLTLDIDGAALALLREC